MKLTQWGLCVILLFHIFFVFGQGKTDIIPLNYNNPREYQIEEITVLGATNISEQTIILLSGLKEGEMITIPGDDISKAVSNIWSQKIVGDVEIKVAKVEGVKVWLIIELTERPRVSDIVINGTSKSERNDIEEIMTLRRGQVYTNASVKNQEIQIDRYFEEKGYYNVGTTHKLNNDTVNENAIIVELNINKGEKVKIEEIIISGDSALTEAKIKRKLKNTKEINFWRFYKRSKYWESDFKEDKKNLIAFYNELGYRDAQIDSRIEKLDEKKINLYLDIDEGNKYYFRDITWYGNYIYKDSLLSRILGIQKGDVYNKSLLNSRLNFNPSGMDVSSLYLDNGYLFFSVNPVEVRIDGDSIDVELRVYEGDQATINRVFVTGNTKTSDHVILRELWTLPGDKFSRTNLIRSQREIAQLGYFDPEQIGIIPVPNPADGTVDIEYQVVEKPSDQLQLSGGWGGGGNVKFVGTLGLVFNNFSTRKIFDLKSYQPLPSGDGQRLSVQFRANGPSYQSFNFSFTEPWLGGKKPNAFTLSAYYSTLRDLNYGSNYRIESVEGTFKNRGVTLNLGSRLKWPDNYFMLQRSLSFVNYEVDNYTYLTQLCQECNANSFTGSLTISRDNRSTNPQFYTNGSTHSLNVSFTPPYSLFNDNADPLKWLEYHKWMFDNSWFIQLTGNKKQTNILSMEKKKSHPLVLNARAHFGFIAPYFKNRDVGPFERFNLGGDGLTGLNGAYLYGADIIGLRGYASTQTLTPDEGGVAFNKFVMELRYPIVTEGVATIFVLGFLEGGNVWADTKDFNPFNMKRSAGMGARIFMPAFGMIGVDYGYGFDEVAGASPDETGWQFHFTIGQQIR